MREASDRMIGHAAIASHRRTIVTGKTVLLLQPSSETPGSTTFTDLSTAGVDSPHTLTAIGDTQMSQAITDPWGGSRSLVLCDGTGDYLSTPNSDDWDFGVEDFTIEFFVQFNSIGATVGFLAQYNATGWQMYYAGGNLRLYSSAEASSVPFAWTPSTGQWYHIAAIRISGTIYLAVDGTLSGPLANRTLTGFTHALTIASLSTGGSFYLDGWLTGIRISSGVARYTGNFTPPTSPFSI